METTVVAVAATTAPQATGARQGQTMPMGHRARFRALAGMCTFLTLLALAACSSATSGRPVSHGFADYDWQVAAISHGGKVTAIPARMRVALQFSPDGQFGANDGVNFHSGTYRMTSDGFTTSVLAVSSVGYAGHDPAISLAGAAISSFDTGARATVRFAGDRLVVSVGPYTLTCQRRGPRAAGPSATTSG
jgi:heat shock protein HslJ